jgi:DNA-binding LacI/PurR family transcriptional regulator
VRTPREKIGEAAATILAGLIRGEVQRETLADLGFEIVEGDST